MSLGAGHGRTQPSGKGGGGGGGGGGGETWAYAAFRQGKGDLLITTTMHNQYMTLSTPS